MGEPSWGEGLFYFGLVGRTIQGALLWAMDLVPALLGNLSPARGIQPQAGGNKKKRTAENWIR